MKKVLAMALALLMIVSILPMSVLAAEIDLNMGSGSCDYYNVIEKNDYDLAPGAVESEIIINDDSGTNRNVVHVIEVDPNNDNIYAMPSFKNISEDVDYSNSSNWGTMVMSEQAAYAEETLGLNVVGAMNVCLSWSFEHPYGLLVYEGKVLCDNRASCETCGSGHPGGGYLAIDKNGKAELRDALAPLTGDEWMAQTVCFAFLVKDGVNLSSKEDHADSARAPRSVIGVKADGSLVIMMNDGRMSPYSAGFTTHEMAEMMISLGCVSAINCDGGGSSTFITKREGTGELVMQSRPSDGAERETLTGILIVSKAVADGKFDHASIDTNAKYVTPGSTVAFTAIGADSAGGPADIPSDVTWQLADPSMGTVKNGVFTSNGTVGTAMVQMVYNGEVVGEDSVEVVIPTAVSFTKAVITVPFTKTVQLGVKATVNNGLNEVILKDGDVTVALSDEKLGTLDGFSFTADDGTSGVTQGYATVTFVGTDVSGTTTIRLGKGSEIVENFEDKEFSYTIKSMYGGGDSGSLELVTAETGMVKNGDYAMAVNINFSDYTLYDGRGGINIWDWDLDNLKDAVAIGFWMYIPEDSLGIWAQFRTYDAGSGSKTGKQSPILLPGGYTYSIERDGWYYVRADLTGCSSPVEINHLQFYVEDYVDYTNYGYYVSNVKNQAATFTFYIDDVTVDYSDAVEDREGPQFETVYVSYGDVEATEMKGQTIDSNIVTLTVQTKDYSAENAVGLDITTAKAYLDGVDVSDKVECTANGLISLAEVSLGEGNHNFRIEISDANGNPAHVERNIVVDATEDSAPIMIVPTDPEAEYIPSGALYWIDVKAADVENVQSVTTVIDLNGTHTWELDHKQVAKGFEATYSIDVHSNNATITLTKSGNVAATGEYVLASLPIRVWENPNSADWNGRWIKQIVLTTDYGVVTFEDDTTQSFAMDSLTVDTEHYVSSMLESAAVVDALDAWHIHVPEAVEDKEATCTESGYTGRTVCVGCACADNTADEACKDHTGCSSVVDWGTTVPVKGHTYTFTDGLLKCACGELFTGVHTDGKTYADGVAVAGWVGESYYVDGVKLTGVQKVSAPDGTGEYYYNFGENGVCKNQTKYTGVFYDAEVDANRYAYLGSLAASWQMIGNDWYYFRHDTYTAATGVYDYYGIPYTFDNQGKLIKGAWVETEDGFKYFCYSNNFYHFCWQEIDGNTYYFDRSGYRVSGFAQVRETFTDDYKWYEFTDEGVLVGIVDGIANIDGQNRYYVNGVQTAAGLIEIDGSYYYARTNGLIATGTYYVSKHSTSELAVKFPVGNYKFDNNGKMIVEEEEEPTVLNGIHVDSEGKLRYYVNGVQTAAGLIEIDGSYYYARTNGLIATGTYYVSKHSTSELAAKFPVGNYKFDNNGKMIVEEEEEPTVLNGIHADSEGKLRYYVNGVQTAAGLIEIDGSYYYARTNGLIATGTYYITKHSTPELAAKFPVGNYKFDNNGKMIVEEEEEPTVLNGIHADSEGKLRYYVNGVQTAAGLIEIDGSYYYARTNGLIATGTYYITKHSTPELAAKFPVGNYKFDNNGKMIVE